jgi:hypothetical protein
VGLEAGFAFGFEAGVVFLVPAGETFALLFAKPPMVQFIAKVDLPVICE